MLLLNHVDKIFRSQKELAQGMAEYGLIVAFVSLVAIGGILSFGGGLGGELTGLLTRAAGFIRPSP